MGIVSEGNITKAIFLVGDIILMYVALVLALALRYNDFSLMPGPQPEEFLFHFSILHVFCLVYLYSFDFYDIFRNKSFITLTKNLVLFSVLAFTTGAVYFYLNFHSLISPKTILFIDVLIFSALVFLRSLAWIKIAGHKRFEKRVAVVGWCPEMDELVNNYLPLTNCRIAAVFRPNALEGFQNLDIYTRHNDFARALKIKKIDLVVFAIPSARRAAPPDMLSEIDINIPVASLESFYEEITGKVPLNLVDKLWMLEIIPRTSRKEYVNVKRVFDAFLSFFGLLATAVLFPFIALAIKIDSPGPVLYVQKRKGKGGRDFDLYKFRSMFVTNDQHSIWRATRADQVTRVGKLLKKTHIDEFPQFFNIFRGDISFVGPRPEWDKLVADFEKTIPLYRYRYLVRPGFTGWAQINYKASTSVKEAKDKFEYDLYYIKNRSFLLDMAIIAKTIQLFFR